MYTPGAGQFNTIAYGNNVIVAMGNDSPFNPSYSFDGTSWFASAPIAGIYFQKVIFTGNRFVAVGYTAGNNPVIMMSTDGIHWTGNLNPSTLSVHLYGVAYGAAGYVAVGAIGGNSFSCYSEDGVFWSNQQINAGSWLTAVTSGNGKFIAVGPNGRILYSENGYSWAVVFDNPAWGNFQDVIFVPNID